MSSQSLKRFQWILASGSPRRQDLLKELKVPFKTVPSRAPETRKRGESPGPFARRLAVLKARSVAGKLKGKGGSVLVLGADTIVVLKGKIFGKPRSVCHAAWMLSRLSGKMHRVYTGVALVHAGTGRVRSGLAVSKVRLREISEEEALRIGAKHMDKSGSYACQDKQDHLVKKI